MNPVPLSEVGTVLILEADQLCADALQQAATGVFPGATFRIANRVSSAMTMIGTGSIDLLLSGVYLSDGDTLELLAACLSQHQIGRILVVTRDHEQWVLQLLRNLAVSGVFDMVNEGLDQFRHALRTVAAGCTYWSSAILERLRQYRQSPNAHWRLLTPAEQLVLSVIGDGSDDQAAAVRLEMKPSTVQSVRRALHRKLGIQHKGGLVQLAVQSGFVRFGPEGITRPGLSVLRAACRAHPSRRGGGAAN
jgi:DNA-binding NarL/FixJ family response regulator